MDTGRYTYSSDYKAVIELAQRFASATGDHVVRLGHLLAAYLSVDKTTFCNMLGVKKMLRPGYLSFTPAKTSGGTIISSQVCRILSLYGGRMDSVVKTLQSGFEIGMAHLAAAMLVKPCGPVLDLLQLNAINSHDSAYEDAIMARAQKIADRELRLSMERARGRRLKVLRKIKDLMTARCHGQEKAVGAIISRVAAATGETPSDRGFRPVSFGFIGGPGTGKTLAAVMFRDEWAHAFGGSKPAVLDMSRFSVEQLITDICGRDPCWKDGGKPGALTSLAVENPNGVIIIENIDKAHPGALVPVANMLIDGKLTDEFTGEEVSFANNIVILTTNQGTSYIDSGKFARLCSRNGGAIPREKLIEGVTAALEAEAPSKAGILSEILSKVDVPVLFKRHGVQSMREIVGDAVDGTLSKLKSVFKAEIDANREELVSAFMETLMKLDSAHGIAQLVDSTLITTLEKELLNSSCCKDFTCKRISISVDPLPQIEMPPNQAPVDPNMAMEARTRQRIRQAKHLEYAIKVTATDEETAMHITNLRHTVMPSIEDAGWFSVCPPDMKPEDLVGMESAWDRVRKLLAYSESRSSGEPKPNHILLYGPPGTGKTAFAKAIAHTLNRSFICVNAAKFTASVNDNRAISLIQQLFATAERTQSIVFIDECDAIGSRDGSLPTQAPVINTLLTLLDGYEDNHVMVIGATNRPEMLDHALTRPGRMHTRIKVDVLRKEDDRSKLVDIFCRKTGHSIPEGLKELIVRATDSWAPANILSVLREMFDLAGNGVPTRRTFAQARTIEFAGDETQRPQLTEDEKRQVATHEAGHALVATLYGHRWLQVTINGCADNLGFLENCKEGNIGRSKRKLIEKIDVALAGNAAERTLGTVSEGSESDFAKATAYARTIVGGGFDDDNLAVTPEFAKGEQGWERIRPKVNAILKERMSSVSSLLAKHESSLRSVVDELVRRGTLFSEDVSSAIHVKSGGAER